jgi:hypothetical protein
VFVLSERACSHPTDRQVNIAVDLAGRAGLKVPQLPTIPGFELRKILIKLAAKDVSTLSLVLRSGASPIKAAFLL